MTESSEDVRERYRTELGVEFGDAFHQLWNEWAWSLMRRNEFRELFSHAEDVSLLNALTGGDFTWDIQQILWDDLLLRLCRLTDPEQTGRKGNLTVRRLPPFCEQHDAALRDQVQSLVDAAVAKAEFARDWRNRRISHSDLATAVGKAEPLAPASLQNVTSALDAVHAVLNAISIELLEAEIANLVTGKPRARAFLAYARQLADSVKFIDAVVDPNGATRVTDTDVASAFLRRLGLRPNMRNVESVIDLREAARRFT
ncbi:MAG: hypothetical protein OXL38_10020 [Gammaproteobacteria bacterium]|nr:hypothetical protein [Gammaproteobacteria bacterium]